MDISIIIVNYNVRHFLKRTIESILASKTDGIAYDIHVVDNESIDGSVDMIMTEFPNVNLIANDDNVGFSTANNQAIKIAKGKYILILNPDTVIEEDTLRICYEYMESHKEVGATGVKMIDGAGKFLPESKRDLPTVWNSFTKLAGLASLFPKSRIFNGYALGHLNENKRHKISVLCGAFMFVRKSTINKVGMFDERFFMYGEDIDWSRRIIEGDYEIHYLPDTTIIHYKGESTKKASLNYVKTFYGAMGLYVEKHYTGGSGKVFSKILKLGIGVRAGISGFKRLVSAIIWPLIDAALIGGSIFGFSKLWATFYFDDPEYYAKSSLSWNIVSYALILAFVMWFVGYYQKSDWQKRLVGIFAGLGVILITYALMPEEYRSSRVIILMGSILGFITTTLTSWVSRLSKGQEKKKNILIVAKKVVADNIISSLEKAKVSSNILGIVNPSTSENNNLDYLNSISQLEPLSRILKVDEVIFSSENLSMKEIMQQMMKLSTKISYKIAGDNSLSIIGSSSKNTSGELYNVNLNYNLEEGYYKHIKRIFDFTFGILMLGMSPILLMVNKLRFITLFKNIMSVILGMKTIVGYSGSRADYQNLPNIKSCILSIPVFDGDTHEANMYYARAYSIWKDLEIFVKGLTRLADKY